MPICQYCGESQNALKNHVRLSSGDGHGQSGQYPDDFDGAVDADAEGQRRGAVGTDGDSAEKANATPPESDEPAEDDAEDGDDTNDRLSTVTSSGAQGSQPDRVPCPHCGRDSADPSNWAVGEQMRCEACGGVFALEGSDLAGSDDSRDRVVLTCGHDSFDPAKWDVDDLVQCEYCGTVNRVEPEDVRSSSR